MSGANFYAPQYNPKSLYTDGCSSGACMQTLGASSSLTQGKEFDRITAPLHGGKRSRRARKMRGGATNVAAYPSQFSEMLPQDMHASARIGALDTSFADLPQFVGKYGNQTGGRRSRRRSHRGGMAPITMPSMLLTAAEEPAAMLNPQWYTENMVVPSFQGPANSYAQQAYENQIAYENHNPGAMPVPPTPVPATGGGRRRRNNKNNKKSRKNNKKSRKSTRRRRTLKAW
jgi:hypothetical protein